LKLIYVLFNYHIVLNNINIEINISFRFCREILKWNS